MELDVYEIPTVWDTPELIQSLADYATWRQETLQSAPIYNAVRSVLDVESPSSLLLVRIQAAADYYTDDYTLMNDPSPVLVDLTLDPYILNAVPRSLLPTAGYLGVVGLMTWLLSRKAAQTLKSIANAEEDDEKKRI